MSNKTQYNRKLGLRPLTPKFSDEPHSTKSPPPKKKKKNNNTTTTNKQTNKQTKNH